MTKRIFGFYPSEKEAITVINSLGLKGFKTKEISLFTNHSSANSLQKQTDANVYSSIHEPVTKKSFFHQIRDVFTKSPVEQGDFNYTLLKFGFDDETIEMCLKKIDAGHVLIVLEDMMKMGHSTISEIIKPVVFDENNQDTG